MSFLVNTNLCSALSGHKNDKKIARSSIRRHPLDIYDWQGGGWIGNAKSSSQKLTHSWMATLSSVEHCRKGYGMWTIYILWFALMSTLTFLSILLLFSFFLHTVSDFAKHYLKTKVWTSYLCPSTIVSMRSTSASATMSLLELYSIRFLWYQYNI